MEMEDLHTTLVKTSFLEQARRLASNYCLPTDREILPQPGIEMQHIPMSRQEVRLHLLDETVTKATEPNLLRKAALDTVEAYGSEVIRVYTDYLTSVCFDRIEGCFPQQVWFCGFSHCLVQEV